MTELDAATLVAALHTHRLLAIVRSPDPEAAVRAVLALAAAGVQLVEVSLTSRDAFRVLARCRDQLPAGTLLGAGTVRTREDAQQAQRHGAQYVVTPALGPGQRAARELGLPLLAGALTPSEVERAVEEGAAAIKLFPASLGGPEYLRALRDPFPDVAFVPVGGVSVEVAADYLAVGAAAVGVGSPLLGDAATGGSTTDLTARVQQFRTALGVAA